jgi:hypothetical protein
MTKSRLFISVELMQLIHDLEVEWKRIMKRDWSSKKKRIERKNHVLKNQ